MASREYRDRVSRLRLAAFSLLGVAAGFGWYWLASRQSDVGKPVAGQANEMAAARAVHQRRGATEGTLRFRIAEVESSEVSPVRAPPAARSRKARIHPRASTEWQGMLIDLAGMPPCEGYCQQALACLEGMCGPCEADADCLAGEACVIDHCVISERVECQRAGDCPPDEVCMLSGLSEDRRGNREMEAHCSGRPETIAQSRDQLPAELFVGGPTRATRLHDLLQGNLP
jgi:hypothetical protein